MVDSLSGVAGKNTLRKIQEKKRNVLSLNTTKRIKQPSDTNSSRQAAITEHITYHNTNPAGSENQLSVHICAYDPFSVYDKRVDFYKWGPHCNVLLEFWYSAKLGSKRVTLSLTHTGYWRRLLEDATTAARAAVQEGKKTKSSPAALTLAADFFGEKCAWDWVWVAPSCSTGVLLIGFVQAQYGLCVRRDRVWSCITFARPSWWIASREDGNMLIRPNLRISDSQKGKWPTAHVSN